MKLVVLESPWAGDVQKNTRYARAAMVDSFARGEAPFASHVLYAASQVLNDASERERQLGMEAGFAWGRKAEACVVYMDLGTTPGMQEGVNRANALGLPVETRLLGASWMDKF